MRKLFYNALNFTLFGNIFIALCALAQALLTYTLLGLPPSFTLCAFLFLATLCMYNCSLLFYKPFGFKTSEHKRIRWFFAHQQLNILITLTAGLALIPLFFTLTLVLQVVIFFLAIVSLAYLLPVFKTQKQSFSLRNIAGLKLFLIATVWAISVVLLPVLQSQTSIPHREIIILWIQQFVLYVAIALQFDVRDMYHDQAQQLKTLPTIYGAKKANLASIILLLISVFIVVILNDKGLGNYFFATLLSILLLAGLILKPTLKNNSYYYFLLLDGILVIQYMVLLLFNWLI
jgi:4-hydroxybenzoate polyprenyltransferase